MPAGLTILRSKPLPRKPPLLTRRPARNPPTPSGLPDCAVEALDGLFIAPRQASRRSSRGLDGRWASLDGRRAARRPASATVERAAAAGGRQLDGVEMTMTAVDAQRSTGVLVCWHLERAAPAFPRCCQPQPVTPVRSGGIFWLLLPRRHRERPATMRRWYQSSCSARRSRRIVALIGAHSLRLLRRQAIDHSRSSLKGVGNRLNGVRTHSTTTQEARRRPRHLDGRRGRPTAVEGHPTAVGRCSTAVGKSSDGRLRASRRPSGPLDVDSTAPSRRPDGAVEIFSSGLVLQPSRLFAAFRALLCPQRALHRPYAPTPPPAKPS